MSLAHGVRPETPLSLKCASHEVVDWIEEMCFPYYSLDSSTSSVGRTFRPRPFPKVAYSDASFWTMTLPYTCGQAEVRAIYRHLKR